MDDAGAGLLWSGLEILEDTIFSRSFLLLVLILFSAFFSACEAAFFSLNPLQLTEMKEKKGRSGSLVHSLLAKPRELLITIYIGNELVNIGISVVITSIAITLFGNMGVGIAIGVGTFILLIFGEIVPKTMSIKLAQSYALLAAYPLKLFYKIVHPPQQILTRLAEKFVNAIGISALSKKEPTITDEEFHTMVQMGVGEGVIESEEREMIHNIIKFSDTTVSEIMTPKIDMVTLNTDDSLDEIIPKIMENFYSRVPVYDEAQENIIGILLTKHLNRIKHLPKEKVNIKSMLHPTLSVPKSKKIKEMLADFKKLKRHMAIVLDEYGSVAGLVTLEDILEELVGEIDSEMRSDQTPVIKIDKENYKLMGVYSLHDFNVYFKSDLPEDQYNTIGGLVFGLFGRIPRSGEAATQGNFKFRVEKMKGPRILRLHLTLLHTGVSNGENGKNNRKAAD
ncbi:MAG: gliding motility protein GldE [Nitrospinaceae bacterium]|nr:MAG: gliding motility protein GldE [Nitrospinaceae bacterium]